MDSEDDESYIKKFRTKGKTQTYLPNFDILELTPRKRRQGKCVGAALEFCNLNENKSHTEIPQTSKEHTFIINDIWYHIAKYIPPEDIKNYSLICRQSANSIKSRSFWLQTYRRYCQQSADNSNKWVLNLPEDLQMKHLKHSDKISLKQKVIQALYICYPPFKARLNTPYTLDSLVGKISVSSWHKTKECLRLICYKFQHTLPCSYENNRSQQTELLCNNRIDNSDNMVDNWECLADDTNNNCSKKMATYPISYTNELNGAFILVVYSEQFGTFPTDMIFSQETLRFSGGRELQSADMVTKTLELDFVSTTKVQTYTLRYLKVQKLKVIPWWHPDFRTFSKCD